VNLLIENCATQEFLAPFGKWSGNPLEGEVFSSSTVALRAVSHEAIAKFNLVFIDSQAKPFLRLNYYAGTRPGDTALPKPA
jgi:hypothetical protein